MSGPRCIRHLRHHQRALIAEFKRNGRAFVERAEKNPWTHELRTVLAIGDQKLIDEFGASSRMRPSAGPDDAMRCYLPLK